MIETLSQQLRRMFLHVEAINQAADRLDALEGELRAVDQALARRPALGDLETRAGKIEHACGRAGRADQAEAERDALKAELEVAHQIGDTFWEALKRLHLTEINVANPGQHVSDVIDELAAANALGARLATRATDGGLFRHLSGCIQHVHPDRWCDCGRSEDETAARACGWLK